MSALIWKTAKPQVAGWYWRKLSGDRVDVVEVAKRGTGLVVGPDRHPVAVSLAVAWAGPIAWPVEPKPESLAVVRYSLGGTYSDPRRHYWGGIYPNCWSMCSRLEMLEWARARLLGGRRDITGEEIPADSCEVTLWTSRRVRGRWNRRCEREVFTAANIDAAIAAEKAKQ